MHEYFPRHEDSPTIITTRDKRVGYRLADREDPIPVPQMDINDAGALLRSKTAHDEGPMRDLTTDSELLEILGNSPTCYYASGCFHH